MKFNNKLALVLVGVIAGLWIVQGLNVITLSSEVVGASIAAFTLIVQYYFRKAPPTDTPV